MLVTASEWLHADYKPLVWLACPLVGERTTKGRTTRSDMSSRRQRDGRRASHLRRRRQMGHCPPKRTADPAILFAVWQNAGFCNLQLYTPVSTLSWPRFMARLKKTKSPMHCSQCGIVARREELCSSRGGRDEHGRCARVDTVDLSGPMCAREHGAPFARGLDALDGWSAERGRSGRVVCG